MIENITIFDICIFLGILCAMLISSMPKKMAMLICLVVSIIGIMLNGAIEAGYLAEATIYPMGGLTEAFAAIILILIGARIINYQDRRFFHIMAGFLMLSSFLNSVYIPLYLYNDILTYRFYTVGFYLVATSHVLTMFVYSDGIRKIFGNICSYVLGYNSDYLGDWK